MTKRWTISPALALFSLSPTVAELLSGSAPPREFFNPFTLILLAALYGSGAVLCRELTRRWRKGWLCLLCLGAAYGILEEGVMVKSFFDPAWVDLGEMGTYGRWVGVNWVWAAALTVYHAVFSIAIPVLLVELAYPSRRADRWVGRRTEVGLWILLTADVLFGFLFLTPYRPPLAGLALASAGMLTLVQLARRLGDPALPAPAAALPRPGRLWLTGFLGTLGLFFVAWVVPGTRVPPMGAIALIAVVVAGSGLALSRIARASGPLGDMQRLALAAGGLTFFIVLAPLQELDAARADDTTGMALVGLAAVILLVALAARLRAEALTADRAVGASPAGGPG